MGNNEWWQGLNDLLGTQLDVNMTPNADYTAKLNTVLAGANPAPEDAEQVRQWCQTVTDTTRNRFACVQTALFCERLAGAMFGAPFNWGVDGGGAFTHAYETKAFRDALDYTAALWNDGVFHPDSFASVDSAGMFKAGDVVLRTQGGVGYRQFLAAEIPLGILASPKADGGGLAQARLGAGTYRLCAIRKQDSPDRVRELLSILNYLAAPFGSEEDLYLRYGTEGVHYTWDDKLQAPVETDQAAERLNIGYLASPPFVLFDPGEADFTKQMHAHHAETIPTGIHDASLGLYSATNDRQATNLFRPLGDLRDAVIQGQKTLADWDAGITEWRSGGGDQIRDEFEAAYAEQNG